MSPRSHSKAGELFTKIDKDDFKPGIKLGRIYVNAEGEKKQLHDITVGIFTYFTTEKLPTISIKDLIDHLITTLFSNQIEDDNALSWLLLTMNFICHGYETPLSNFDLHRLLAATLLISSKLTDHYFKATTVARCAGVPAAELKNLEEILLDTALSYPSLEDRPQATGDSELKHPATDSQRNLWTTRPTSLLFIPAEQAKQVAQAIAGVTTAELYKKDL